MSKVFRPLDSEAIVVLTAMHAHRDASRAAAATGMRSDAVKRVLRRVERCGFDMFDQHHRGLSPTGLALVAASREYHDRLARMTGSRDHRAPAIATLRLAAAGSRYPELVRSLASGNEPLLLHLIETTPVHACQMLDTGDVDAAYVWEPSTVDSGREHRRDFVATERVMIATSESVADELGPTPDASALTELKWATTPSGLPLMQRMLDALGCPQKHVHIVDCNITLTGLIHVGDYATLTSPMTVMPGGLVKLRAPVHVERDLVLLTDPRALPEHRRERLHHALCQSFEQLSRARIGMLSEGAVVSGSTVAPASLGRVEVRTDRPHHPESVARPPEIDKASRPVVSVELTDEELAQLRAIRETGSVNRAARVLMISQPALSRRVRKIELRLGARLLVRRSTGSGLSPAAERLLHHADEAARRFHERLSQMSDGGRQVV